jgi:hypothetical protein
MSNQKSVKDRVSNPGTWILPLHQDRAVRAQDMREFKDDCIATHESLVGAECGAVLQLGRPIYKKAPLCPIVPTEKEFKSEPDPEQAYAQALAVHTGAMSVYSQACKSRQHHIEECENKHRVRIRVSSSCRLET